MSKKQVFVIGASGTVGQAAVKSLSSEFGEQVDVKAGVRNPQKVSALNDLKAVTVVEAEMGNRASLKETFRGVESLFIVTPPTENLAHLVMETARAAKEAGVKFLLVISVPLVGVPDTIFGKLFGEIESTVPSLGVPCAFLRLPMFMEMFMRFAPTVTKESRHYATNGRDKPMALVASDDTGLAAATILASPENHAGNTYTIVSDRASYGELAAALTKLLGRKIEHVQISYEESTKAYIKQLGMPEWQVNGVHELFKLMEEDHRVANPVIVNDFSEITGKKPTDLSTWVSKMGTVFK